MQWAAGEFGGSVTSERERVRDGCLVRHDGVPGWGRRHRVWPLSFTVERIWLICPFHVTISLWPYWRPCQFKRNGGQHRCQECNGGATR
jgi:hypothetical protein